MRRRRVIGVVLVSLAIVGGAVLFWPREPIAIPTPDPGANARRENRPQFGPDESRGIQHTHVGKTREDLVAELGDPTREGPWPIGFPSDEKFERYKGLRTLEWHWESGKFLASVYPEGGRWVCFNSVWVPKGATID
jgi:hypothetical protein